MKPIQTLEERANPGLHGKSLYVIKLLDKTLPTRLLRSLSDKNRSQNQVQNNPYITSAFVGLLNLNMLNHRAAVAILMPFKDNRSLIAIKEKQD